MDINVINKLNQLLASFEEESQKLQNFSWFIRGKGYEEAAGKLDDFSKIFKRDSQKLLLSAPQGTISLNPSLSVVSNTDSRTHTYSEIVESLKQDFQRMSSLIKDVQKECKGSSCDKVIYQLNNYHSFIRKTEKSLKSLFTETQSRNITKYNRPGRFPFTSNSMENTHRVGQSPYAVASL